MAIVRITDEENLRQGMYVQVHRKGGAVVAEYVVLTDVRLGPSGENGAYVLSTQVFACLAMKRQVALLSGSEAARAAVKRVGFKTLAQLGIGDESEFYLTQTTATMF